jgi:hypothetical protein
MKFIIALLPSAVPMIAIAGPQPQVNTVLFEVPERGIFRAVDAYFLGGPKGLASVPERDVAS